MNSVRLKQTETARSVSSEVQRKLNTQLVNIIIKCIKNPNTPDKKMIAQFVKALMNKRSQQQAKETLQMLLNQVDCVQTPDQVMAIIGKNAFKRTCNLINISSGPEEENSQHLRIFIGILRTGLPDKTYYLSNKPENRKILNYYKYMLNTVGNKFHYDNLDDFVAMEKEYINIIDNAEDEKTVVRTGAQLEDSYKHINWEMFWKQFDIEPSKWRSQKFVIYSQKWLAHVNSMFVNFTMDQWRLYLRAMMILCYIKFLPADIKQPHFHLYNYLLNGQRKPGNRLGYILQMSKDYLEIPLSRVYVSVTQNTKYRAKIKQFIKNIQDATIERINMTEWLEPKTRIVAAQKVKNINLGVLYSTHSYNYKIPQLTNNVIKNVQIIGNSLIKKDFRDVENKYMTELWSEIPVYNVNAYYSSAGNRLFIPIAITNWPFYCEDASLGWNYGSLGCVVGHEITHAFDDYGKDYDEKGNRAEWWTANDKRKYNENINKIIKLYSQSKLYGRHIDAKDTLGENIADLGGMASALQALKNELDTNKIKDAERLEQYKEFFLGYATSWREKERRAHGLRELITDVHSPAIIRVNNIVRHFQEWYDAFDICSSDPLFLPVDQRIRIF